MRKHLTYANVAATLALVIAVAGGTAYAANTIGTTDIINGQVKSADIGTGQVQAIDVGDGQLNDEDVGQGTFVDFTASINQVAAHDCRDYGISGINAQGDHLLLTPDYDSSNLSLTYEIDYQANDPAALLHVCNPTDATRDDGDTNFNLLVIDAQ